MKAGPNNVPDSIWAQVSFLFSSFVLLETKEFFIVNIGCIYNISERERVGRLGMMKTGPTMWDVLLGYRWVFFIISFVLFDINQYFIAYTGGDLQNTWNQERLEAWDTIRLERR